MPSPTPPAKGPAASRSASAPTPSASPKPLLAAKGLFKFHGPKGRETAVLSDVSFQVAKGEFLCIMGPSGSGKSTLLHLIAGLDDPSSGEVILNGNALSELKEKDRTRLRRDAIGFVFQFFNLLPTLNVEENVGLPLAIRGQHAKRDHVARTLERMGIEGRLDALPHELSGGQMQRVSIARALAGGQPLLLCDEPTGNLSQQAGLEVMNLLRELVNTGRATVLLVTHNPRDAAMADRVLFLVDGKLDAKHALVGPGLAVEQVHERLAELHI
ncbi:MAG: ABC transporter ATP-binding protein [Planctomycetota bacterium]